MEETASYKFISLDKGGRGWWTACGREKVIFWFSCFFFFKWKDASRFGSAEAFLCGVPPNPLEVAPWVRRFIYSQSHVSCVPFPLYPGPPDDGAEQEEQRCWQRTQKRAEGRRVSTGAAVWKENTVSLAPL